MNEIVLKSFTDIYCFWATDNIELRLFSLPGWTYTTMLVQGTTLISYFYFSLSCRVIMC